MVSFGRLADWHRCRTRNALPACLLGTTAVHLDGNAASLHTATVHRPPAAARADGRHSAERATVYLVPRGRAVSHGRINQSIDGGAMWGPLGDAAHSPSVAAILRVTPAADKRRQRAGRDYLGRCGRSTPLRRAGGSWPVVCHPCSQSSTSTKPHRSYSVADSGAVNHREWGSAGHAGCPPRGYVQTPAFGQVDTFRPTTMAGVAT